MREPHTLTARLLVADDNKVNRLLLTRSLELQGHRVACAENGCVALDMLRAATGAQAFDLLLLDMEMPEMTGFEVLEHLSADATLRDLPVIVTSSLEGIAHIVRCIELGAEDYLSKPVNRCCCAHGSVPAWRKSGCATAKRRWCGASLPPRWRKTWRSRASHWAAGACRAR